MNMVVFLFGYLYAYCTDFVINLANILNLSYYEINFVLFIVIYPLLLLLTPIIYMVQRIRLRSWVKRIPK